MQNTSGADSEELLVETHGLTKRYGQQVPAVDALDLSVRRGEVFGFLGPNGAGKTTTLRMLVGLIRPSSGAALVAGYPPGRGKGLARIGALIESPAFYPYLSARENLKVLAEYSSVRLRRVDEVLEVVDLAARARDRFASYSLGMKQRLGVAAALLKDPELLILDEPTNGLDPQGMADMSGLIRSLGRVRQTVLLSSHVLSEVEQICDRVAVIRGGRLVAQTTVAELRGSPRLLVRAYPMDRAQEVLEARFGMEIVQRVDGTLRLRSNSVPPGDLTALLVHAGVELRELRPVERSLEDAFFGLMSQEVD